MLAGGSPKEKPRDTWLRGYDDLGIDRNSPPVHPFPDNTKSNTKSSSHLESVETRRLFTPLPTTPKATPKAAAIALLCFTPTSSVVALRPSCHYSNPASIWYQVRPACVEDHDDLMPVFAAQSDLLSATYGEFFLADMIELQDSENKVGWVQLTW